MSESLPTAEKDAGRIDALRIESGDGTLTFATRHDGQIEAQTSGERVVFDREAAVRLADWLTKHDPDAEMTVRTERDHRWFEYGRWFNGFGSSMDPHRCDDPGVICEWRERAVTTTTITTPWVRVTSTGDSDA